MAWPSAALASSAVACFEGSPSKFARPSIMPWFQRRMSSHATSSSPSMYWRDRTDIGSANSVKTSASPRSANPSISSWASFGIMPRVRAFTSRGRKGGSQIARIHCWCAPSDPSMFVPMVRFSVEGSVAPVKTSGVRSTARTSSHRVTNHS